MTANNYPSCIILTGMHRSATSAAAAALKSAGLHMGDLLFGANEGNPRGYFEDADFVLLHEDALKALGMSKEGWVTGARCEFREPVRARAAELIERRRGRRQPWGWKDPRTVLFLDEWSALLPEARYVFAFRSPWAVLDSLYRRYNTGDEVFDVSPELAAEVYVHYGQLMLDFAARHAEQVVFLVAEDIVAHPEEWVGKLRTKWGLPVGRPDAKVVDPEGMSRQPLAYRKQLLAQYFPETIEIYHRLLAAAGTSEEQPQLARQTDFSKWALQDWVALRRTERWLKKATAENRDAQQKLYDVSRERDEWRRRAEEMEQQYGRFKRLVQSSVFWRLRRGLLRVLARMGLQVHVGDDL